MKKLILPILLIACMAIPAAAQQIKIDLPGLEERASEVVDVTLDANMLRFASGFLSEDKDERAVRDMVHGLQGVYVRSYEFEKEGQYDRAIIEKVRAQLGANWNKIVNVRSKTRENVEIYTQTDVRKAVTGMVVISAEPKELTIVNIVGPIDLNRLAGLGGQLGIPKIENDPKEPKE